MAMTPGTVPTNNVAKVHLFVGNITGNAGVNYIRRLFAAYGTVRFVVVREMDSGRRHAIVGYDHVDDADSAIASLHLRYCMSPQTPIIVLYRRVDDETASAGGADAQPPSAAAASADPTRTSLSDEEVLRPPPGGLQVSKYGRQVGRAYREAIERGEDPHPIPLETFDEDFTRAHVAAPPSDIRLPPRNVPWSNMIGLAGPGGIPPAAAAAFGGVAPGRAPASGWQPGLPAGYAGAGYYDEAPYRR